MELSSRMRTSSSNTQQEVIFQWPMLDQTQMDLNSSLLSSHAIGSTESIVSSEKSPMDGKFLMLLNQLDPNLVKLELHARLPTVVNSHDFRIRFTAITFEIQWLSLMNLLTKIFSFNLLSPIYLSYFWGFGVRKTRTSRRGLPREKSHHFPSWRPFRRRRPPLTGSHRLSGRRR